MFFFPEPPSFLDPKLAFLNAQINTMSEDESKKLLLHFMNRNVDLRLEGRDQDWQMSARDIHMKLYSEQYKNMEHKFLLCDQEKKRYKKQLQRLEKKLDEEKTRAENYKDHFIRLWKEVKEKKDKHEYSHHEDRSSRRKERKTSDHPKVNYSTSGGRVRIEKS